MKLKDVLDKTTHFFREKGMHSPRLDAEILLAHGLGVERIRLYLDFDRPLSETELHRCRELVKRRSQGEPVAHIVGYKDFYRSRFQVSSDVLIPRPETEQIVEEAVGWAKLQSMPAPRVVDLGTGSGCLGLSVLVEIPEAKLLAVDLSAKALRIAQANAESLGVADRAFFVEADAGNLERRDLLLEEAGFSEVDLLLANPPYIPENDPRVEKSVHQFEPHTALYSEEQGLFALKKWSEVWTPKLAVNGLVLMEMGQEQGASLQNHYQGLGLQQLQVLKDLSGHDRVIKGVRHG